MIVRRPFRIPSDRRVIAALTVGAAAAVAVVVVITIGLVGSGRPAGGFVGTDMKGNTVSVDPDSGLTPEVVTKMRPAADTGARFEVPSVGLDVPLGQLTMTDDTITPPGFASAYGVRNLGVSPDHAADGTVFVAMHSLRGGAVGPGNYLIDVEGRKAEVAVGAVVRVAGVPYEVFETKKVAKDAIRTNRSVWADAPGRLVVITCLQTPEGGPSVENLVVMATMI